MDLNFSSTTINTAFNFYIGTATDFDFDNGIIVSTEFITRTFDFNKSAVVLNILKSPTNNFNSIWCDANASLTNGRFYISHEKDLTIVNNKNGQVYVENFVSKTVLGSTNETLINEDIVDITVAF
ncbi:hypothetical protein JZU46_02900 [bacterium]|nr:hypothetical protein [bacterium]